MKTATNYGKPGGPISADLATTQEGLSRLESYVMTGNLWPETRPPANPLGRLLGLPSSSSVGGLPLKLGESAKLFVLLNGGSIEDFSIEIKRVRNLTLNGETSEEPQVLTEMFTTKVSKIGTTTVSVEPEVKALFLTKAAGL